jgi:hypothetical protein
MLDIRAEVANALDWGIAIPGHKVTAKVAGGGVILQGVVELPHQRSSPRRTCAECPG